MAKPPRILAGQTAAISRAARAASDGRPRARSWRPWHEGRDRRRGPRRRERTASELGPRTVALPLDVTDRDSFTRFLDGAEEQLGPLDVLVNNAGIMPIGRFLDEDDLAARRTVDINLHGVILGMKLALARMLPRDRGHVVNLASQAGRFGTAGGRHLLGDQARRRRPHRGRPRRASADGRPPRRLLRDALPRQHRAGTAAWAHVRGMHNLEPSEVADAIVDALGTAPSKCRCRGGASRTDQLGTLLPRPVAEGIGRAMKADRVLAGAEMDARRHYELRASNSKPGLEPAPSSRPSSRRSPRRSTTHPRRRRRLQPARGPAARSEGLIRARGGDAPASRGQPAVSHSAIRPPISGP